MGEAVRRVPARCGGAGCFRYGYEGIHKLKKLEEAGGSKKENSAVIDLDTIILAGLERGLTITDIRKMQLGQVVDFVISFNNRQKKAERQAKKEEKRGKRHRATQSEINAFFG